MEAVNLTAEEFKVIHNALCDLDSVKRSLEDVVHPDLYKKLSAAIKTIRKDGLANAYKQEEIIFKRKSKHYESVRGEYKLRNTWSMFEVDDLFQQHSFPNATRVQYDTEDGPKVASIEGNTWVDLYQAADKIMRDHHTFIEGFIRDRKDPTTLKVISGS